jgi:lysophospholipase L1-like esterase
MRATILVCLAWYLFIGTPLIWGQRVACVGDSITYGSGIADRANDAYPAQLEEQLIHLGLDWEVGNFGVSGATLLRRGDKPYTIQPAYSQARAWLPDIVVIMLGTNDSKEWNWIHSGDYVADYLFLIDSFLQLSSQPQVWICKPVPAYQFNFGIREEVIRDEIPPFIDEIAARREVRVIDLYTALSGLPGLFPDGIHPNAAGAGKMAEAVAPLLAGIRRKPEFNLDGINNFQDFAALARTYHHEPHEQNDRYDLAPVPEGDGRVTMQDIGAWIGHWLSTPALLAHWALNEAEGTIAHDRLGVFPGTVYGEALWNQGALVLDGIDDYLDLDYVTGPMDGPFTLFLRIQGGQPGQVLLSQEGQSDWILTDTDSGEMLVGMTAGGRGGIPLKTGFVTTEGRWHELRLVWDGTKRHLYADGLKLVADSQAPSNMNLSRRSLLLGTGKDFDTQSYWTGQLDDIRIYQEALLPE